MSPETRYRIEELEELTGLSRRLIYDYISRELVPPAMGSGKGAHYVDEHYDRLRLISLLRSMGFRLERIEEALDSWSSEEISRIVEFAEGRDVESLDALNEWLTTPARPAGAGHARDEASAPTAADRAAPDAELAEEALHSLLFSKMRAAAPGDDSTSGEARHRDPPSRYSSAEALERVREMADVSASAEAIESDEAAEGTEPSVRGAADERSSSMLRAAVSSRRSWAASEHGPPPTQSWQRVRITPDVEISYRSDIDPERRSALEELIARARELLAK